MKIIINRCKLLLEYYFYSTYCYIRNINKNSLILQIDSGGLGDHLFYSSIPRIAKESGRYRFIYISSYSNFRNEEIKKLVWELNPYVDGFINKRGFTFRGLRNKNPILPRDNIFNQILNFFGLPIQSNPKPEIYYAPKVNDRVLSKIIYDPNYISNSGKITSNSISKYFIKNDIKIDIQLELMNKNHPISCNNSISCGTIFEFCDVLFSANKIYCLVSGTATLAVALGKSVNVIYGEGVVPLFLHDQDSNYIKLYEN